MLTSYFQIGGELAPRFKLWIKKERRRRHREMAKQRLVVMPSRDEWHRKSLFLFSIWHGMPYGVFAALD
jgi:hypothetical protein